MPRLLSIGLLFCLITPFLAAWQFLSVQIHQHQQHVAAGAYQHRPENDEVLLKFSVVEIQNVLRWEHEHEFEYNGEMYDVIRLQHHGDTMMYWCHHDIKETQLRESRNQLFIPGIHPGPCPSQKQVQFYNFFQTLFQNTISVFPSDLIDSVRVQTIAWLGPAALSGIGSPPTPPPKIG